MFFSRPAGSQYVIRPHKTSYDWIHTELTLNGEWQDLDLTGIIPKNTHLVIIKVSIHSPTANDKFWLRQKTIEDTVLDIDTRIQVNDQMTTFILPVSPDSNGLIQYLGDNVVWDACRITILGWFV